MLGSYHFLNQNEHLADEVMIMKKKSSISRREFFTITGITAAGLFITPEIIAMSGKKPLLRFGMISDSHYADRVTGNRFCQQSLSKVKEFVDLANQKKLDFIIELGDFKDQDIIPIEINTLKYLSDIESVFQKFDGPTFHVLGNHDMDSISKKQFLEGVVNTGISSEKGFYSFYLNRVHFIVLDANYTIDGTGYDRGNFDWKESFIPTPQLNWLKEELNSNEFPTIVFVHQNLDESESKEHNCNVQNAAEVRRILEQSEKVLCVFQGHIHKEIYNYINGIHYYSVNAVVDGDGPENNAYQIVTIYKNGSLIVDGFRRASYRSFPCK